MGEERQIDFARLLGFKAVSGHIPGDLDFRDETFAAKLGAKVGEVEAPRSQTMLSNPAQLDFTRLLGFDTVSGCVAEDLDFRNETFAAKLGAKVGEA